MNQRPLVVLLTLALLLSACTAITPMGDQDMDDTAAMPAPVAGEITVVDPRARPSPMAAGNGAAYMMILNGLEDDVQLVSAESPAAEVVELHETVNDEGVMRMVPQLDGFAIPAGGGVELAPGGKHVMLIGLLEPLETGGEIEITLNFDNGDVMSLTVPVVEMDGMPMNMEHGDGEMDGGEMDEGEMEMEATEAP